MNYQQVLALIQQFIVANGNNEITANVLRPILEAILAQPNDLIGDLGDLQTNDQSNLVSAINEVLDVISPPIGSVNTKIHPISLFGIDPELPELTKIAEAVRLQGPFTCDAGQQMVFHTIATVGNQTNGSIVTRYYRLLRNLTTIGGVGVGQTMLPSWFMPDGVSEYINPVADGTIIELGDIASSEVWDVFNLGNNGEAWDMNEYRFIRATQNGNIQLWAFVGQERYYGGPDIEVEPDIFEAFESDFFLITDQTPGGGNIFAIYTDVAAMLADQTNQIDQEIYYVEDASADNNLNFPSGETKLQAFYRYNGVATGSIDDYTLISAPYANQSGSDFQGITTTNSDDINLSGNGTESDPLKAELTQDVKDEIQTGLEAIDEGNGIGWRLKGRNPDNYGNIGKDAIDLGASDSASTTVGATGDYSTVGGGVINEASGIQSTVGGGVANEASGIQSTVGGGISNKASGGQSTVGGGYQNEASGGQSTVGGGYQNEASGGISTVGGGYQNEASGTYSTVSGGINNLAKAFGEFLGGLWSTIKEGSATTWIGTDRIFGIGNGTGELDRSDAFNVYKNGVAELPSVTNALIDAAGGKTIPTKEWVQEQSINQQLKITANATVLANWNRNTVFLDGTNLEISVNVSTNELDENTEIYFYNMSDSEVDFKFTAVGGWSLPDDATLEPNGTCILMRVLDEQKLILIGNE